MRCWTLRAADLSCSVAQVRSSWSRIVLASKMLEQRSAIVIAKQSGRATEVELSLENGCSGKCFRSADPFKAAVGRSQIASRKAQGFLGSHFQRGNVQCALRPPEHYSSAAQSQKQNGGNGVLPLSPEKVFHLGLR